jgi:hypothetical protein
MCQAITGDFIRRLELKVDKDGVTAGMGRGVFKLVCLSTQPCGGFDPDNTLTIYTKSGTTLTYYTFDSTINVGFRDGPWTAAVIHSYPVNANIHVAAKRKVMIMRPGHFALYGSEGGKKSGKASLGKAKKVNHKGEAPSSSHPGVDLHRGTKWRAQLRVVAAGSKNLHLGLFEWEEEAIQAYDRAYLQLEKGKGGEETVEAFVQQIKQAAKECPESG